MEDKLYDNLIRLLKKGPITPTQAMLELKCGRADFYNKLKKLELNHPNRLNKAEPVHTIYALKGWTDYVKPGEVSLEAVKLAVIATCSREGITAEQLNSFIARMLYRHDPNTYEDPNEQ